MTTVTQILRAWHDISATRKEVNVRLYEFDRNFTDFCNGQSV